MIFGADEFAFDRNIGGRQILLNGVDFTIIGVAPESFSDIDQFFHPTLFIPVTMASTLAKADSELLTDRANRPFTVKGRVKPGVSLKTANGEGVALAHYLARSFPKNESGVWRGSAKGIANPR
jgi:hypothetical protein